MFFWWLVAFFFLVSGICGIVTDLIAIQMEERGSGKRGIWYKIVKLRLNYVFFLLAGVSFYLSRQANVVCLLPMFFLGGLILVIVSVRSLSIDLRKTRS
jgi:hypothetical protein